MNISELHIERFIRYPEKLTAEERKAVETTIKSNPDVKAIADFYREFYEQLEHVREESAAVPPTIPLRNLNITTPQTSGRRLVLAAMSPATKTGDLESVVTLGSEENKTLVRILRKNKTGEYNLFVISKYLSGEGPAILSIKDLDTDLIIDESGRLSFQPDRKFREYDWQHTVFYLRFAKNAIEILTSENGSDGISLASDADELDLELSKTGSRIIGTLGNRIVGDLPSFSRIIFKGKHTGMGVVKIEQNEFSMMMDTRDDRLQLWFYV